jgi:hypothetical protein
VDVIGLNLLIAQRGIDFLNDDYQQYGYLLATAKDVIDNDKPATQFVASDTVNQAAASLTLVSTTLSTTATTVKTVKLGGKLVAG